MAAKFNATCHFLNDRPSLNTISSKTGAMTVVIARLCNNFSNVAAAFGVPPNSGSMLWVIPNLAYIAVHAITKPAAMILVASQNNKA